jgi:hypothetical protein
VDVDETRAHHQPVDAENRARLRGGKIAFRRDASVRHGDVRATLGSPRAVDEPAAGD